MYNNSRKEEIMPKSETITTLEYDMAEITSIIADAVAKQHGFGHFGEELQNVEFVIGDGEGCQGADIHDWIPGPPEVKKVVVSFKED